MAITSSRRPLLRALAFLIFGVGMYVYDGMKWHSWMKNLPLLLAYLVIVAAMAWALDKKQRLSKEREQDINNQ